MSIVSKCIDRLKFRVFENAINRRTWTEHDRILAWAEVAAQKAETWEIEAHYVNSDDPIVRRGYFLRQQVLQHFRNRFAGFDNIRILIHTPPSRISPGGFSLFNNLAQSIEYLGVPVRQLDWDTHIGTILAEFKPTFLLTSDSREYLNKINWGAVSAYKLQHGLHIGLTASLQEYGNTPLCERLAWADQHGVDFYYSFRAPEYLTSRSEYQPFFDKGYDIFSVEFGANPLLYYPIPDIERDLDYVFLASINRDKWLRYFEYLPQILTEHHGFLDGPGWRRLSSWAPPATHRFLYARARVGINLHIPDSIDWPSELNERTYILAACGVPQLVDNALLLPERFSVESMFVAKTPADYHRLFSELLHNPDEARARALRALDEVYTRHTCFHRAEKLINQISRLQDKP